VNRFSIRLYEGAEGQTPVADFLRGLKRHNPKVFKKYAQYIRGLAAEGLREMQE
jgi:hypothetical protein